MLILDIGLSLVQLSLTAGSCEEEVCYVQTLKASTAEPRIAGWWTDRCDKTKSVLYSAFKSPTNQIGPSK